MEPTREFASPGLHDYVERILVDRLDLSTARVLELGAGSGAFTARMARRGASVIATDLESGTHGEYSAGVDFLPVDLDDSDFPERFGGEQFDLVLGMEVIEHLEAPLRFLRNASTLLRPGGLLIITTPNVDNIASRLRFLRRGQLRGASVHDDPGHISPILLWTFVHRLLPRTDLELVEDLRFPEDGFCPGGGWKRRALISTSRFVRHFELHGDNHVFVLRPRTP